MSADTDGMAAFQAEDMAAFVEVGAALAEVRDHHLYRGVCPTFEAYCASRFGIDGEHANRLIALAQQYAARGLS